MNLRKEFTSNSTRSKLASDTFGSSGSSGRTFRRTVERAEIEKVDCRINSNDQRLIQVGQNKFAVVNYDDEESDWLMKKNNLSITNLTVFHWDEILLSKNINYVLKSNCGITGTCPLKRMRIKKKNRKLLVKV